VVVPYTGRPEQLSSQRALIRMLSPMSLVISQASELDLGKVSIEIKLQQFTDDYRETIINWASQDVMSIPSYEGKRLMKLARTRDYGEDGKKRVKWQDEDYIVIDTLYGRRAVSCASLWFRVDGEDPLLSEVDSWLKRIPVPSDVYAAAVKLADQYWMFSETDDSKYRYILSRLLRSLESVPPGPEAESIKASIKPLCRAFDVNFEEALAAPKKIVMSSSRCVPHLLNTSDNKDVLRLAVFMLLTKEYAARWASTRDKTDILWQLERIIGYKDAGMEDRPSMPFDEIDTERINGIDLAQLGRIMSKVGFIGVKMENGEILLEREPVRDSDMAQRLDPLPEQLLTNEQSFSDSRIAQALRRKCGIDLKALITNSDQAVIEPRERKDCQDYALSMDFPPCDWPAWLRKNYKLAPVSVPIASEPVNDNESKA
jgi:hypothetical protein